METFLFFPHKKSVNFAQRKTVSAHLRFSNSRFYHFSYTRNLRVTLLLSGYAQPTTH